MALITETNSPQPDSKGRFRRWWRIWVMGGVNHDEVLKQIADEAGWSGRYLFLIIVSAAISLLGLLMPSVAVLIGAMLLSPLMMPIIGFGFGIATLDFGAIRRAAIALILGSLIAIFLSVVFVSISPVQTITSEIASRTRPTLFDLLVALLSAVAGAYALIRGRGGTVVGVAIAIALMPPLAVVGFGIATWNYTIFLGALLLFITNAVTIALTAALVARAYGFGSHLSPRHTGWQLTLFVVALGVLAVPLAAALKQIAFEAMAQRQIREAVSASFARDARLGEVDIDFGRQPITVRAVILTPRVTPNIDRKLSAEIARRLAKPVDIHVDQVRISVESAIAEATQISRAADGANLAGPARQDAAVADVALISGADRSEIKADLTTRTITARTAPLAGLHADGYRALENRARRAVTGWTIMLVPPDDIAPPLLPVDAGIVDPSALDIAAWVSARLARVLKVDGGSEAQRAAISRAITNRGGRADLGRGGGPLRLNWDEAVADAAASEN